MQELRFEVECPQGTSASVIRAQGYIDTHTATELEQLLREQLDAGRSHLVLDLTAVDYVSSAGWGVLIASVRRARHLGGDLRLAGMRREVNDVFELLEFPSIMHAHADVEQALTSLVA